MAKHESDVVLRFKTDGQIQYAQTIKEINQTMNTAAKEYKNHIAAMGNDATETQKLTAAKQKLQIQLEGAKKRTAILRAEYEESVKATGENSAETKKLYDKLLQAETAENSLKNALDKTNDALEEQQAEAKKAAINIESIEAAGEKVKGVGEGLTKGVTAPILAIGAAAMVAFTALDDALDGITTATGATGEELESLQASFETVASRFPAEMEDISAAIGEVNTQFGLTNEALETTSESMLKFAEINGADVSESTKNAKKSIELFRLSAEDIPMVLDVVSKTSQDTGVSVDQLFNAVNTGAPQLKAMGLTYAESATMIGQMEKAGIDSASSLGYLAKASVVYAKDGKSMQEGLNSTIDSIKNATTEQEKLTLASEVFGTKAAVKMVEAIDSGALSVEGLANSAKNASGTLNQTYEDILDPIDKVKVAQNNLTISLGKIGEQIQIAFLPVFEMAIDLLSRFSQWFGSLDDGTKQMIVTIAGLLAAIGPVLVVVGTLMSSISKISAGLKVLGAVFSLVTSPIGLVVLAIVALIAIFVVLWTKCEWFRDFWKQTWEYVKSLVVGFVTTAVEIVKVFASTWLAQFNSIKDLIVGVFKGIIDFVTGVFSGDWEKAWQGIVQIFSSITQGIGDMFKIPINFIIGLLNSFIKGINKIKLPKWVPGLGGKGIDIPMIPQLAKGGNLLNGQAIVGEAGPELLTQKGNKTTVTPLSETEKANGISGAINASPTIHQTVNFGQVDANNPSEIDRLNRKMLLASKQALAGTGGI